MRSEALEAPQVVANMLAANAGRCADLAKRLRAAPPPFGVTCARGVGQRQQIGAAPGL